MKLLELDPDTVDSEAQEGSAGGEDVDMEEAVDMSEAEARKALCNALTYHLSSMVNLIFG